MDWREAEAKIVSQSVRSRDEAVPQVTEARLSLWDVVYALNMAMACLVSYWIMTDILSRFVDRPSDFLGGMCAVAGLCSSSGRARSAACLPASDA
jgi:hypothetical protein